MNFRSVFYQLMAVFFIMLAASCSRKDNFTIYTVRGEILTADLGKTLTHEHILVDFIGADSTGYHRWNREDVIARVLPFLEEIKAHGYQSLFECTPAYLGRDPLLYKELSARTGLNIITNTGYYGAVNNRFLPAHAFTETADQLAERWIEEFNHGIEDSGIKPGFIKIAIERDSVVSDMHEKLVRAAARTHLATGLTIASHTGPAAGAYREAEILKSEGILLEAFIWVHALEGDVKDNIALANQGMWISYDKMNDQPETVELFMDHLRGMKEARLLHKVLLSHDAGWYKPGQENGGTIRSFTSIETILLPKMKESGFSEQEIHLLLVKNPEQAFGMRVRATGEY
jgi:phosphotriesterase-related protein